MTKGVEPIQNFADVHRILKNFIPKPHTKGAYTLERMQTLMSYLGEPQDSYQVIHVAGTSGKTSTSYYIAALLGQAGQKVGLTVSPHIDEVNERIQIGLKPLSEKRYCKEFSIFLNLVERSGINPTYFEILTAFAYWEFKRQKCQYAVVEVGLGGLLDATNVITRKDKINVITDIGLDHQEVLGKTTRLIASQKAGIIRPYNTVVCYEQSEEIIEVIRETTSQQQAVLHEIWPLRSSELPKGLTLFQRKNWYLAYSVFEVIAKLQSLPALNDTQLEKSTRTYIPARMEINVINKKTVIIDGSHNQQKLQTLVKSIRHKYPSQKFDILVSFVSTKQSKISECIKELLPIVGSLIITSFTTENHEKTSLDPLKVVGVCEDLGFSAWEVIDDPEQAFKRLIKTKGDTKLVTGSFYLLNHIRPLLKS
jgi:dihydrofolate synthase/folylpolyglutamate synthase